MLFLENLQKLVKGSKDDLGLSALNGIKALSMMLIIAGHALLFIVGGPVLNSDYYAKVRRIILTTKFAESEYGQGLSRGFTPVCQSKNDSTWHSKIKSVLCFRLRRCVIFRGF